MTVCYPGQLTARISALRGLKSAGNGCPAPLSVLPNNVLKKQQEGYKLDHIVH